MEFTSHCREVQFYWNTDTPTCAQMVSGRFHARRAELSSCDRGCCDLRSLEYLLSGPLKRKFAGSCSTEQQQRSSQQKCNPARASNSSVKVDGRMDGAGPKAEHVGARW